LLSPSEVDEGGFMDIQDIRAACHDMRRHLAAPARRNALRNLAVQKCRGFSEL
jgi:hypothetical protein